MTTSRSTFVFVDYDEDDLEGAIKRFLRQEGMNFADLSGEDQEYVFRACMECMQRTKEKIEEARVKRNEEGDFSS